MFAETRPGEDAAGLGGTAAQGSRLEAAANQFSLWDQHVVTRDDSEEHALCLRAALDFIGDELLEEERALAVADEDERAADVAGGEILVPRGGDVAVRDLRRRRDVAAGHDRGNRADGHLAIDGRERAADAGETGKLVLRGEAFLAVGDIKVAVEPGVVADGGIDVEAVDRGRGGWGRDGGGGGARGIARGGKIGGGEGDGANVLAAGEAEPVGVVGVSDGGGGLGLCGKRAGQGGDC